MFLGYHELNLKKVKKKGRIEKVYGLSFVVFFTFN